MATGANPIANVEITESHRISGDRIREIMKVNLGPSHPMTHGTVKFETEIDGETIVSLDVTPGYLHRGFEKSSESKTWINVIPYTDRLNYVSPLINNFCYAGAVEKFFNVPLTPRCIYIRTLLSELSRIGDHFTCIAASLMELGAMTAFLHLIRSRDDIWELVAHVTGARLTVSYVRFGGLKEDLPAGWIPKCFALLDNAADVTEQIGKMVNKNRIFLDRMKGVGILEKKMAINLGVTGPLLRATGYAHDLRKKQPYLAYADLDFDVPVGQVGDCYDRYYVRMREIEESIYMCRQLCEKMPQGEVNVYDYRFRLPKKEDVYGNIEGLMNHFKLVYEGVQVPKGEVYYAQEGGNGELGFYLVSDGTGNPYKVRVRPPSFINTGALKYMLIGQQIADIVPVFGQINMIGGECDR